MRTRAVSLVVLVLALSVVRAPAQTIPPGAGAPGGPASPPSTTLPPPTGVAKPSRIDPEIRSLLAFRAKTGITSPKYRPSDRFEHDGVFPVVIRFSTPPDASQLEALARAGVEWERGAVPLASGAWAAKVGPAQIALLDADPTVFHVGCDLPRNAPRPLVASANETGITRARHAFRAKDGKLLDGTGTKIADIDSGLYVFHPAFFRADGGVFTWIDVDGDGAFTPGVDGVDLDGSGTIEANEVLAVLSATGVKRSTGFDPSLDYLFVDLNGNGVRDVGAGFDETTPAYGEPIFVVDDVDGDGRLAISEKLLRLSTSKVAAARAAKTYTRGSATSGITAYGAALVKDPTLLDYASHGTGVAGILVGGIADRSQLLGLAPGAELLAVGYGSRDPAGTVASVQWAIDRSADVILTEYAPYTGYPLDGSSEEEVLLDAAVDKGIAVVNPAGNLKLAFKHRTLSIAVGANDIKMATDASFGGAPYVQITILHRGDPRTLAMKLTLPDAPAIDLPATSTDLIELGSGRLMDVIRRTTSRGTHEIHLTLYAYDAGKFGKLPAGAYHLSIDSDAAFEADVFCSDSNNSWGRGLVFEVNTPARTLCHPATSDKGIAVAAYTLHEDDPFGGGTPGTLAGYSSLGPRIDGVAGIDLAAPDNPMSVTTPKPSALGSLPYAQFGGTSGAGPHVAAALALLKQADPSLKGSALQAKLLDHARRDSFVTSDATKWGKGKLDVVAALGVSRNEGTPPKVKLVAPASLQATRPIELKLEVEDDAPGLRARWDLDYDGKWDTEWEPIGSKTLTFDAPTVRFVRVDVLDADGHVRGATAKLVVGEWKADEPIAVAPSEANAGGGKGCACVMTGADSPETNGSSLLALAFGLCVIARRRRSSRCRSGTSTAAPPSPGRSRRL